MIAGFVYEHLPCLINSFDTAFIYRIDQPVSNEAIMQDDRPTRGAAVRLALAAGGPALCIGFPFVDAFVRDHILIGGWVFVWFAVIAMFLWPAVLLTAFFIYAEGYIRYKLIGLAAATAFAGCLVLTFLAKEEQTLVERGQTSICAVKAVTVTTQYEVRSWPNTIPVDTYTHHLQCPQGGPDEMVTSFPKASKGASIAVLWDPSQRIPAQLARGLYDYRSLYWLAAIAGCVGAFLLLLDALIDARQIAINRSPEFCDNIMQATTESALDLFIKLLIR